MLVIVVKQLIRDWVRIQSVKQKKKCFLGPVKIKSTLKKIVPSKQN